MSMAVPLVVKWGKESISLEFAVASGVKGLKGELEEATGIPADRMKLMAKTKGKAPRLVSSCHVNSLAHNDCLVLVVLQYQLS
jgi:hypothetical protein